MLTSRPEHVSARGPGAARHSCAVSHRLFTEQELTFPQTRPRPPGGKGKAGQGLARSGADPTQTPARQSQPRLEPALPGKGTGQIRAGAPPRAPARRGIRAAAQRDVTGMHTGWATSWGSVSRHTHKTNVSQLLAHLAHLPGFWGPGPQAGASAERGGEPRVPSHLGPASAPVFSSQTFCSRRVSWTERASACKRGGDLAASSSS